MFIPVGEKVSAGEKGVGVRGERVHRIADRQRGEVDVFTVMPPRGVEAGIGVKAVLHLLDKQGDFPHLLIRGVFRFPDDHLRALPRDKPAFACIKAEIQLQQVASGPARLQLGPGRRVTLVPPPMISLMRVISPFAFTPCLTTRVTFRGSSAA